MPGEAPARPADTVDVASLVQRAVEAAPLLAASTTGERSRWLGALADALRAHRDELVATAHTETRLAAARLTAELERTARQLEFMSTVIQEGSYLEAALDSPDPHLIPPRPDLRRMLRPLGPVAVFAASNFPFAFSLLGNDSASALAAGCPVIGKAHPGHPLLSARVADLTITTLRAVGAPDGAFGVVFGWDAGIELVDAVGIAAVGFTGSTRGGRLLFDRACARPDPIPFYGELGSINPVLVTERAGAERAAEIAKGFADSFTRDGGQYCTKPGILFHPAATADTFEGELSKALERTAAHDLLTPGMVTGYRATAAGIQTQAADAGAVMRITGAAGTGEQIPAMVVSITLEAFLASPEVFLEECFGPFAVVVRYETDADLIQVVPHLPGSLTCTFHTGNGEPQPAFARALHAKVGRVIHNGWPTGVAVAWAQHHGGPWGATTNSIHSSVGATSIRRWLTPIAFQDVPEEWLPPELHQDNPLGIPRRVDGRLDPDPAKEPSS